MRDGHATAGLLEQDSQRAGHELIVLNNEHMRLRGRRVNAFL